MIRRSSRCGFSLLEVMIATAILAASAMVLLSLISLGTRFGSKAEVRIGALVQAQSILDESILRMHAGESIESYTGVTPGAKPRSYRVTVEPFDFSDPTAQAPSNPPDGETQIPDRPSTMAPMGMGSSVPSVATNAGQPTPEPTELVSVKIELYDSESPTTALPSSTSGLGTGSGANSTSKPLIELTRLVRRLPIPANDGAGGTTTNGLPRL